MQGRTWCRKYNEGYNNENIIMKYNNEIPRPSEKWGWIKG